MGLSRHALAFNPSPSVLPKALTSAGRSSASQPYALATNWDADPVPGALLAVFEPSDEDFHASKAGPEILHVEDHQVGSAHGGGKPGSRRAVAGGEQATRL